MIYLVRLFSNAHGLLDCLPIFTFLPDESFHVFFGKIHDVRYLGGWLSMFSNVRILLDDLYVVAVTVRVIFTSILVGLGFFSRPYISCFLNSRYND